MKNDIDENGLNIIQRRTIKANKSKIDFPEAQNEAIKKFKIFRKEHPERFPSFWETFTNEDRKNVIDKRNKTMRKTMESKGKWKIFKNMDDYELYFKRSSFKFGFNFPMSKKEKYLLETKGIFSAKHNSRGVVRDHLLSRRYGFENNIPVWIISHPANCEIILHSENVRRSFTNDNQITLEELLEKISQYK